MRLRIGSFNDKYWVEKRCFLGWQRLPDFTHWLHYDALRYKPEYIAYFDSYESARASADEYLQHLVPKVAVYTEIKE